MYLLYAQMLTNLVHFKVPIVYFILVHMFYFVMFQSAMTISSNTHKELSFLLDLEKTDTKKNKNIKFTEINDNFINSVSN